MEQVTNTAAMPEQSQTQPAKKSRQAKVKNPDNLTFPIFVGSGSNVDTNYIHPDEGKNPLSFIGNAVKQFDRQFSFYADFPANKQLVTIPAVGRMGEKERALRGQKNYLEAITKGMEQDAEISDKSTVSVLSIYRSKGWKFTTYTKKGILTVADEKLKEVTTKLRVIKAVTLACPELKDLVQGNKNRVLIAAKIETEGLEAGIKLAKELSYKQLPAIQK